MSPWQPVAKAPLHSLDAIPRSPLNSAVSR